MSHAERRTIYFDTVGKQNTLTLLRVVKEYVERTGIENIVIASTTGETGVQASKLFKRFNLIVVTHHFGFLSRGIQE